jgi:hypothetical protein
LRRAIWILFLTFFVLHFGAKEIDTPFERPDYKAKYYVFLFPGHNSSKSYKLPTGIHVYSIHEEGGGRIMDLQRVFFPDRGIISFDGQGNESLEIGEQVICNDSDGKTWLVELSKQKIK